MYTNKPEIRKYPGQVGFDPFILDNLLEPALFKNIQKQMRETKKDLLKLREESEYFFRHEYINHPYFSLIHEVLRPKLEKALHRPLKNTYCFVSIYQPGKGQCLKHTDNLDCKYTLDLCVDQTRPWTFTADNESDGATQEFLAQPGQAIILSGTHHPHARPYNLQADNFCDLVFFHFTDDTTRK